MNQNNYSTEFTEEILNRNKKLESDYEILSDNLKTCEENTKFYQDQYFDIRVKFETLESEHKEKTEEIEKLTEKLEKLQKENAELKLPFYKKVLKILTP